MKKTLEKVNPEDYVAVLKIQRPRTGGGGARLEVSPTDQKLTCPALKETPEGDKSKNQSAVLLCEALWKACG
jgi:hypothetical protein